MTVSQSTGFHGSLSAQEDDDDDTETDGADADDDGDGISLVILCSGLGDFEKTGVTVDDDAAPLDAASMPCRLVMDMPRPSSD
jgi:hypothetical protein